MLSPSYYLLRSRASGQYLAAHPEQKSETVPESSRPPEPSPATGFLLLFSTDYDALSYLNHHATEVANQFGVEAIARSQLKSLINRWSFTGVSIVTDPLVPLVDFLEVS
ncbi:hypothetical protein IQ241_14880 [Romeria aff. gracilis LEGE 07310]|uniref:Uncharacterized protein n=1 Tax=Vasconcelosia minhoensis LEGE 07310 TaxID=915328 RepID=A0A8J7DDA6_9CYAN|nr:hypothetical protein [Romeria gracilis]MBE9078563.1 hypothetical protein [Romeria aff. gracilis LEGE 07310]